MLIAAGVLMLIAGAVLAFLFIFTAPLAKPYAGTEAEILLAVTGVFLLLATAADGMPALLLFAVRFIALILLQTAIRGLYSWLRKRCTVTYTLSYRIIKRFSTDKTTHPLSFQGLLYIISAAICVCLVLSAKALNAGLFSVFLYVLTAPVLLFIALTVRSAFVFDAQLSHLRTEINKAATDEAVSVMDNSIFSAEEAKLHNLREQHNIAVKTAVEDERLKVELITNVSHDLRTPLTSIIGYGELLEREKLSAEGIDSLCRLNEKAEYMSEMVESLFELTKVSSGVYKSKAEELDLMKLLEQTLGSYDDKLKSAGLELRRHYSCNSLKTTSDGARLHCVFANLVGNIVKYSLPGTRVHIFVSCSDENAEVRLTNIAASEKKRLGESIGLLKIAGMSCTEINKLYLLKAAVCVLPSMALGGITGILLGKTAAAFSKGNIVFSFSLPVLLLCVGIAAGAAFVLQLITVRSENRKNVCENLSFYNSELTLSKECRFESSNPVLLYSVRSYALNASSSTVSAMLVFSALIVISCGIFISNGLTRKVNGQLPCDYMIWNGSGFFDETGFISYDSATGFSKEDVELFAQCPQTGMVSAVSVFSVFIKGCDGLEAAEVDDASREKFGLDKNCTLSGYPLLGTTQANIEAMKLLPYEGEINAEILSDGAHVVAFNMSENAERYRFSVGDKIEIEQCYMGNGERRFVKFTVEVCAVIDKSDLKDGTFESYAFGSLMWCNDAYDVHSLKIGFREIYINAAEPSNTNAIKAIISNLGYTYPYMGIENSLDTRVKLTNISDSFRYISIFACAALAVFACVGNAVNVNMQMLRRKKLWGTLRAVGLQRRDMLLLLIAQTALETGIALLMGIIIAVAACLLLDSSVFDMAGNSLPAGVMCGFSAVYFLSALLPCIIPVRRLFKLPVAECIKES